MLENFSADHIRKRKTPLGSKKMHQKACIKSPGEKKAALLNDESSWD